MSALNAIYACKMYRTHKDKDKIKAAIENPINVELVQQLAEYLNEDEVAQLSQANEAQGTEVKEEPKKTKLRESEGSASTGGGGGSSSSSEDYFFNDEFSDSEEGSDSSDESSDADAVVIDDSSSEGEVEESTRVEGKSVTSATTLYNDETGTRVLTMSSVAEVLKGTLNSRQDTAGVNRATVKENELWLHYNDSMNLNTVMVPVIEFMNAGGYTYLNFNRLARSENAIVFEICAADTDIRVAESGDENE